jgi:hypothetical protein
MSYYLAELHAWLAARHGTQLAQRELPGMEPEELRRMISDNTAQLMSPCLHEASSLELLQFSHQS